MIVGSSVWPSGLRKKVHGRGIPHIYIYPICCIKHESLNITIAITSTVCSWRFVFVAVGCTVFQWLGEITRFFFPHTQKTPVFCISNSRPEARGVGINFPSYPWTDGHIVLRSLHAAKCSGPMVATKNETAAQKLRRLVDQL